MGCSFKVRSLVRVLAPLSLAVISSACSLPFPFMAQAQQAYPACLNFAEFDRQVRSRPPARPDQRLLIVGITEADIQQQGRYPFSDQTLANTLAALQRYKPAAIGLAIYRDIPVPPGSKALLTQLQKRNVITIYKLGTPNSTVAIASPKGAPAEQTGFIDLLVDPDGTVRRSFLFAQQDNQAVSSFAFQLAELYLATKNVFPQPSATDANHLQWGSSVLSHLERSCPGQPAIDTGGYQVPLYYRASTNVAPQVSLTQVLTKQVKPDWVKGKVVLIGFTARSIGDDYNTPYLNEDNVPLRMPGIVLQAQMVSQLLTAAIGDL